MRDYDNVPEIRKLHSELQGVLQNALDKAIRLGDLLSQEKARLKHGQWLPWLKTWCPFHERTATNYIRVFQNRERLKSETVSDLTGAYKLLAPPENGLRR